MASACLLQASYHGTCTAKRNEYCYTTTLLLLYTTANTILWLYLPPSLLTRPVHSIEEEIIVGTAQKQ